MRARNAFSLSGVALLATLVSAQGTEQDELPSAPSAAQQQSKPQAPATPPQTAPAPGEPASQEKASPTPTQPQTTLPAEQPATQSPKNESPKANVKTSSPETSEETAPTIFRTVNEVNVVFTVTDKHGRYVKDLKKNDFKVIDDTRPADEIRSFHNETDLPLQVGLLVDASNSVRDRFKFEQESAIEFLNQTIWPKYDKAFVDMAQRADVIVYTISTNIIGSRNKGDKILERIANATGGRPFFPFQITDVANAFAEIQDELRSQYALSYKPADLKADGRYHSIEILAQNHKNLRVRSRRGYYAPAQ